MQEKPTKGHFVDILLRSPQTIFTVKDIALLWGEKAENTVRVRLHSYVRSGKLRNVYRGMYAKDSNYSRFELATRIYTPAYLSFETVLSREGITFQQYGNIFVASYVSREITADNERITYVRMKDFVLRDTTGISHREGIAIATKERAFLDRIYVSKEYHFDNLNGLDWGKVFEILPIYHNKRMEKTVLSLFTSTKTT